MAIKGMQSEIFVPITPKSVWTPVTKPLNEMKIRFSNCSRSTFKVTR